MLNYILKVVYRNHNFTLPNWGSFFLSFLGWKMCGLKLFIVVGSLAGWNKKTKWLTFEQLSGSTIYRNEFLLRLLKMLHLFISEVLLTFDLVSYFQINFWRKCFLVCKIEMRISTFVYIFCRILNFSP